MHEQVGNSRRNQINRKFRGLFKTQKSAETYLLDRRIASLRCCGRELSVKRKLQLRCMTCRKEISALSNTYFQGTRVALFDWYRMLYFLSVFEGRISSFELAQVLEMRAPVVHKMRIRAQQALAEQKDEDRLKPSGRVLISAIALSNLQSDRGRWDQAKQVFIAHEIPRAVKRGKTIKSNASFRDSSWVSLRAHNRLSAKTISEFIDDETLTEDSIYFLDVRIPKPKRKGLKVQSLEPQISKRMPFFERFCNDLEVWIKLLLRGVSVANLQGYLEEFAYMYHNRNSLDVRFWELIRLMSMRPDSGASSV